jgi:hypothetical protein
MTRFPGVVTLNEDHVPVMVGLDDDRISMVAGEVSIGEWLSGEYVVIDLGEGTFVIEAEEDSISFLPDDPDGFARGIVHDQEPDVASVPEPSPVSDTIVIKEGPPPQPSTVAAFYTLVAVTAALCIWAIISLF